MNKWRFLCKCGDGSAFFENKKTGELMCWWIDKRKLSVYGAEYFGCPLKQGITKG